MLWWLDRIDAGGEVPAPGPPDLALQYIDVRDLAAFTLDALEEGRSGPFDVVSRSGRATMGDVLDACIAATGSDATLRWVTPDDVAAAEVEPWTALPIWLPPGELHDTMHGSDTSKALDAGLDPRPIAETVADTWSWMQDEGAPAPRADRPAVGLDHDAEQRLLARAGDRGTTRHDDAAAARSGGGISGVEQSGS